jgi:D-xylose transport system permease protein
MASVSHGNLMELDAIAACVIGGTSLAGGRGNVLGVLIGALIMATIAQWYDVDGGSA